ncbi:31596_t:CDS:2, partial [Racocetra persica]
SNRNLARHFSAASEFASSLFGVVGVVVSLWCRWSRRSWYRRLVVLLLECIQYLYKLDLG